MPINIGGRGFVDLKQGNANINTVMHGNNIVWQRVAGRPATFQYVRIADLNDGNFPNDPHGLREIQVFDTAGTNVALNKPLSGAWNNPALVNGNTSTDVALTPATGFCIVDLLAPTAIRDVMLWRANSNTHFSTVEVSANQITWYPLYHQIGLAGQASSPTYVLFPNERTGVVNLLLKVMGSVTQNRSIGYAVANTSNGATDGGWTRPSLIPGGSEFTQARYQSIRARDMDVVSITNLTNAGMNMNGIFRLRLPAGTTAGTVEDLVIRADGYGNTTSTNRFWRMGVWNNRTQAYELVQSHTNPQITELTITIPNATKADFIDSVGDVWVCCGTGTSPQTGQSSSLYQNYIELKYTLIGTFDIVDDPAEPPIEGDIEDSEPI